MSQDVKDEPAFPNGPTGGSIQYDDGHIEHQYPGSPGMSLRDWFAGQALAGIMGNPNLMIALEKSKQDPASCAYDIAGFMINERSRRA